MSLDQKITNAIINSSISTLRRYGQEKLQQLRMNMDLDKDGHNDIDQAVAFLEQLTNGLSQLSQSIDYEKLGAAMDKMSAGVADARSAIQKQDLQDSFAECRHSSAGLLKLIGLALAEYKSIEQKSGS